MIEIPKHANVGIDARGGPVNGPFAAAVLHDMIKGLQDLGVDRENLFLYANSATVPGTNMAAIGKTAEACDVWDRITPDDIITPIRGWTGRSLTAWRALFHQSIFDSSPLDRLIRHLVPIHEIFATPTVADRSLPVKFMAVDAWTGKPVVFDNRNPKHRSPNWYRGIAGSMAIVPFVAPKVIYDVVDEDLAEPYTRSGPYRDTALLIDGGFVANLMLEKACRDGVDVLFVVDINGLEMPPLETLSYEHWGLTLQRAVTILVTTNDHRHLMGLERVNEAIRLKEALMKVIPHARGTVRVRLEQILARANSGLLDLSGKHAISVIRVEDREGARPFDFSNFRPGETRHLIHCGHRAACRVLDDIKVV
jgi:hypothetical protein